MVAIMGKCQIAVVPSSNIAYEVCCVGLGLVTGVYAPNQAQIADFFQKEGLGVVMDDFKMINPKSLAAVLSALTIEKVQMQMRRQREFFNFGTNDYPKLFTRLSQERSFDLREVTSDDKKTYFNWANDPTVRDNSVNHELIPWEIHHKWFDEKLNSTQTNMYMMEKEGVPVGQVRFEQKDGFWEINYSLAKDFRGRSWGTIMIKKALEKLNFDRIETFPFRALAKSGNKASSQVFLNLSFQFDTTIDINGTKFEVYVK